MDEFEECETDLFKEKLQNLYENIVEEYEHFKAFNRSALMEKPDRDMEFIWVYF